MTTAQERRAAIRLLLAPHILLVATIAGLLAALVVGLPPAIAVPLVAIAAAYVWRALKDRRSGAAFVGLAVALTCAGWGWGSSRLETTTEPTVTGQEFVGVVDVETLPQRTDRSVWLRVRVVSLSAGRVDPGTRLLADVPRDVPAAIRLGTRLRVTGRAGPAATARSPGWWRDYLARTRIAGRLDVTTAHAVGVRGGLTGVRDRLRNAAADAVGSGLTGERRAVVRGMTLGGGDALSEETAEALRDAGVWHLLAVSGQNISAIATAIIMFLTALGLARRPVVAVALVALVSYCLICNGGASVVRAGIVGALAIVAQLQARDAQRWYLLLVGLTVLLIHQPRAIGDPGLQLSFMAVAGLFTMAAPIAGWCRGFVPDGIATLMGQAGAATVATAPVVLWHFGELSLAGLLVNLVAVPLAMGIVVTALTGLALGAIAAPLGVALAWATGLGAAALLWLARVAAAVPGATVALPAWSAIAALAIVIAVVIGFRRMRAARGPLVARRPSRALVVCAIAAVVAAVAVARPVGVRPEPWPANPAVTALDVGQGDAILLRSPDGGAALIDTGPPGTPAPIRRALQRAGVRRLDVLAITHDQLDHSGAATAVLDAVDVGTFATPVAVPAVADRARQVGAAVRTVAAGDTIQVGVWRLEVLWPQPGFTPPEDANDASLVIVARAPGLVALLTGDAESGVLSRLRLPNVDLLKVAHHGSADPGLAAILRRLTPATAVISVGDDNRYGHPVPQTIEALEGVSARVARTDRSGDVTVVGAPGGITVATRDAP